MHALIRGIDLLRQRKLAAGRLEGAGKNLGAWLRRRLGGRRENVVLLGFGPIRAILNDFEIDRADVDSPLVRSLIPGARSVSSLG